MKFTNSEPAIGLQEIANVEASLGFLLPVAVRNLYLTTNGGDPAPYVFQNENIDTVITKFLPLSSKSKGTALTSYKRLVVEKQMAPQQFFPFAVDGGGDYFFVDCSRPDGAVYFLQGDSASGPRMLNLQTRFEDFWLSLKEE